MQQEPVQGQAEALERARLGGQPYAPPSAALGTLDVDRAYQVQRAFVSETLANETVAGYKAAVTSPALMRTFGLPGPIAGVLFASGQKAPGAHVLLNDFRTLLVETELAFRVSRAVAQPVSADTAMACVDAMMPAIELADPGFGQARFAGEDLIAANSASSQLITGTPQPPETVDIDSIRTRLTRGDALLGEGYAGEVQSGQAAALAWLINQIVALGYPLEPGHVLLTGAIGGAHPGASGRYTGDFGALGRIEFTVAES